MVGHIAEIISGVIMGGVLMVAWSTSAIMLCIVVYNKYYRWFRCRKKPLWRM